MSWGDPLTTTICVLAVAMAYVNGMHDASNAVSTTVATRALSLRAALGVAATVNLLGALVGLGVAAYAVPPALSRLGLSTVDLTQPETAHLVAICLLAAVLTALFWELLTWWWGMPSSTWHAVLAGLGGAAVAVGPTVPWHSELTLVAVSLLVSPVIGAGLTFALVAGIGRLTVWRGVGTRHLRVAQAVSSGVVAAGHGMHDVLLPMAVMTVALTAAGASPGVVSESLVWIGVLTAVAIAAGTLAGGRRIIRTLARRLTDLSTAQGLAAEVSAAVLLFTATIGLGAPVSTSHTVTSGIVGSGVAVGSHAVRWAVVGRIVAVWVATPFVCFVLGAAISMIGTAVAGTAH